MLNLLEVYSHIDLGVIKPEGLPLKQPISAQSVERQCRIWMSVRLKFQLYIRERNVATYTVSIWSQPFPSSENKLKPSDWKLRVGGIDSLQNEYLPTSGGDETAFSILDHFGGE